MGEGIEPKLIFTSLNVDSPLWLLECKVLVNSTILLLYLANFFMTSILIKRKLNFKLWSIISQEFVWFDKENALMRNFSSKEFLVVWNLKKIK